MKTISNRCITILLLTLVGAAAWAQPKTPVPETWVLGQDLVVRRVIPGVWMHVSVTATKDGRPIEANGLLLTTGKLSVMIDTGWEPDQTRRLLDWAETQLSQPVQHLIVTHAHPDRMGGLEEIRKRAIEVHGHAYTARLSRLYGMPMFHWTFRNAERINLGGEVLDLMYPGPGHTQDNIVVYLPRRRLLYAGCLIKSASSDGLGFIKDANLKTWPLAVRTLIERYRAARILVPGHGAPGGVDLLSHTMELLEQARPTP